MIFTVEETALTAAFDHSSRSAVIADMMGKLGMIDDPELKEQVRRLCEKLKKVKDEDFIRVEFTVYEEEKNE